MDYTLNFEVHDFAFFVTKSHVKGDKYAIGSKMLFRLVCVLEGEATFIFENHKATVSAGDLCFLFPGNDYTVEVSKEKDFKFITVTFSADCNLSGAKPLLSTSLPEMRDSFEDAYRAYMHQEATWRLKLMSLVYCAFERIIAANTESYRKEDRIQSAVRYIKTNYTDKITLEELAECAGCSVPHFKYLFHKQFGISPIRYLNKLRMEHAINLIKSDMYSVTEIAELCGFHNVYYFSNAFKKHTGLSPTAYMQTLK
ncbi:MAG: helix-turn-helix transcriptional regulator [Oscillospiraceae bacterium]|nr:helix-turn-helix transcriptional regulator [Oscillospiraceae bacterium]